MTRRGKPPDYSLNDSDYICTNCRAPGSCATETCPRARLSLLRKLERQADGLVGCVSTVFLAALTGQDAQTLRQKAERGEYGPARQTGDGHWCVAIEAALTREVSDERS
jgi:hypothetical protein